MSDPNKVRFRGHDFNRPKLRDEWTREQCWMAGYLKALKAFKRDIRKGGERSERQQSNKVNWSGESSY